MLMLVFPLCFFVSLHRFVRWIVQSVYKRSETDGYLIACRVVSAIQGIIATTVGGVIAWSCHGDIMKDVHWLTNAYLYFGGPYFFYDVWAMYCYNVRVFHKAYSARTTTAQRIKLYATRNKLILTHHIVLPLIILPLLILYRNDRGDYFFGIFYMIELVVPFLSFREILIQLKLKHTTTYTVTSIALIAVFFVCRILVFPFLYHKYANYAAIPIWRVPANIPVKCNLSSLMIFLPQVYWFVLMLRALKRALFDPPADPFRRTEKNGHCGGSVLNGVKSH